MNRKCNKWSNEIKIFYAFPVAKTPLAGSGTTELPMA